MKENLSKEQRKLMEEMDEHSVRLEKPLEEIENLEKSVKENSLMLIPEPLLRSLKWRATDSDCLLASKAVKTNFLIDRLIPQAEVCMVAGHPSSCKSWILLAIAKAVGSGEKLFNEFETIKSNVLLIDEEASKNETLKRWKKLGAGKKCSVVFSNLNGIKVDNPEHLQVLLEWCEWANINLILFDAFRDVHLAPENDSTEMQKVMDYFKQFTKKGISVILAHHRRKEVFGLSKGRQEMRGSSVIDASLSSVLSIAKIKDTPIEFEIYQSKLRQNKPTLPFRIRLVEDNDRIEFINLGIIETTATKIETAQQEIKKILLEKESYGTELKKELLSSVGISPRTTDDAIREIKKNKLVNERLESGKIMLSWKD